MMNVGQSLDRQDARRKVLGQATYAAEFRMPNLARAVLVQSTVAAGRIAAIDTRTARKMPGVLAVITSDNADKLRVGGDHAVAFPLLQSNDILYNGQHIAIVVAETLQRAQAAAERVSARYHAAEAVTAMDGVLDQAYTPKKFDNGRSKPDSKLGDPDHAMTGAAARIEATYTTPIEHHNPMEPHATIATWQGDKLTVWTATQGISGARETLAGLFGLPAENVTIICPFVGGGFGCKGNTWPHVALTAMAARQVGRPVKLELTRQPTYMRAPGEASGNFALESAMDELAVALRIDPLELRLRNYADTDPTSSQKFASKGLRECYQRGAEAFGWSRRTPEPGSMRDDGMLIGLGMATATYPTNRMPSSARVRLLPDGTAEVASGTQDLGTGTYTTMAQVAGDELGLPVEKVRVELGDSRLPKAPVSGGSMTTASVLPAVRDAAARAREQIFALATARGGDAWRNSTAGGLKLEGGMVSGPAGQVSVADLIGRAGVPFVEAVSDAKPLEAAAQYSRHAFGAQFAEVRVDPDLRTIRVSRFVGAFDCGRVINAKTARSQLIAGIVFGIGMALLEETRVDPEFGRAANSNIADYLVPVNADVPDIQTIMVEAPDLITTPLGVKGIGELPMVGVAAAIANAVYHATGVRVRELPVRLDKLLV